MVHSTDPTNSNHNFDDLITTSNFLLKIPQSYTNIRILHTLQSTIHHASIQHPNVPATMLHRRNLSITPKQHLPPEPKNKFPTPIPHSSKSSSPWNQSNTIIAYTIPSRQLQYSPCPQILDIPYTYLSEPRLSIPHKHIDALRKILLPFEPQNSLYYPICSQKLPNWNMINLITPPLNKALFQN